MLLLVGCWLLVVVAAAAAAAPVAVAAAVAVAVVVFVVVFVAVMDIALAVVLHLILKPQSSSLELSNQHHKTTTPNLSPPPQARDSIHLGAIFGVRTYNKLQ